MSMYRLHGILEHDVIVVHAKNLGIRVLTWNYDTDKHLVTKAEVPEYNGEVDYLRATPDGSFVLIGLQNQSMIKFMRYDPEGQCLKELKDGTLEVS